MGQSERKAASLCAVRYRASCGLPNDNITALAAAVAGLASADWDGFDANDFHKGVVGLSPLILADSGMTTVYEPDGTRVSNVPVAPPTIAEDQKL